MKEPIREEIEARIRKIAHALADVNFLLDNYEEEFIKEYVLDLLEEIKSHRVRLKKLTTQLDEKFGDFQYINPKYKDSFKPERW